MRLRSRIARLEAKPYAPPPSDRLERALVDPDVRRLDSALNAHLEGLDMFSIARVLQRDPEARALCARFDEAVVAWEERTGAPAPEEGARGWLLARRAREVGLAEARLGGESWAREGTSAGVVGGRASVNATASR